MLPLLLWPPPILRRLLANDRRPLIRVHENELALALLDEADDCHALSRERRHADTTPWLESPLELRKELARVRIEVLKRAGRSHTVGSKGLRELGQTRASNTVRRVAFTTFFPRVDGRLVSHAPTLVQAVLSQTNKLKWLREVVLLDCVSRGFGKAGAGGVQALLEPHADRLERLAVPASRDPQQMLEVEPERRPLPALPGLRALSVGNQFTDWVPIETYTALTTLSLRLIAMPFDAARLAPLTRLCDLSLHNSELQPNTLACVGDCASLRRLTLPLSIPVYFDAFVQRAVASGLHTSLTSLQGSGGSGALGELTALRHLWWSGGGPGMAAVAALSELRTCSLPNAGLSSTDAYALCELRRVVTLDLRNSHIGPEGAIAVSGMFSLTSLNLTGNRVGPAGAEALRELPRLAALTVGPGDLGGTAVLSLGRIQTLTDLRMPGSALSLEGAEALAALPRLFYLDVGGCALPVEACTALCSALSRRPGMRVVCEADDEEARALFSAARFELESLLRASRAQRWALLCARRFSDLPPSREAFAGQVLRLQEHLVRLVVSFM